MRKGIINMQSIQAATTWHFVILSHDFLGYSHTPDCSGTLRQLNPHPGRTGSHRSFSITKLGCWTPHRAEAQIWEQRLRLIMAVVGK